MTGEDENPLNNQIKEMMKTPVMQQMLGIMGQSADSKWAEVNKKLDKIMEKLGIKDA